MTEVCLLAASFLLFSFSFLLLCTSPSSSRLLLWKGCFHRNNRASLVVLNTLNLTPMSFLKNFEIFSAACCNLHFVNYTPLQQITVTYSIQNCFKHCCNPVQSHSLFHMSSMANCLLSIHKQIKREQLKKVVIGTTCCITNVYSIQTFQCQNQNM